MLIQEMFGESLYPKDRFGFPIRPGQGMGKWDMRESMKNTYLDFCYVSGVLKAEFDGEWRTPYFIPLQNKISKEERDFVDARGENLQNIPDENFTKKEYGKNKRTVRDGRLLMPESGSYIIDYAVEFMHPLTRDKNMMAKLYTELIRNNGKDSTSWLDRSALRTVTHPDTVGGTTIQHLQKGERVGIRGLQKFAEKMALIARLNITKIG